MKFYLSSAQDTEPYDDLNTNKLMKGYCQTIERETDAKVAFEKIQHLMAIIILLLIYLA